jgi:hypothetical protein
MALIKEPNSDKILLVRDIMYFREYTSSNFDLSLVELCPERVILQGIDSDEVSGTVGDV